MVFRRVGASDLGFDSQMASPPSDTLLKFFTDQQRERIGKHSYFCDQMAYAERIKVQCVATNDTSCTVFVLMTSFGAVIVYDSGGTYATIDSYYNEMQSQGARVIVIPVDENRFGAGFYPTIRYFLQQQYANREKGSMVYDWLPVDPGWGAAKYNDNEFLYWLWSNQICDAYIKESQQPEIRDVIASEQYFVVPTGWDYKPILLELRTTAVPFPGPKYNCEDYGLVLIGASLRDTYKEAVQAGLNLVSLFFGVSMLALGMTSVGYLASVGTGSRTGQLLRAGSLSIALPGMFVSRDIFQQTGATSGSVTKYHYLFPMFMCNEDMPDYDDYVERYRSFMDSLRYDDEHSVMDARISREYHQFPRDVYERLRAEYVPQSLYLDQYGNLSSSVPLAPIPIVEKVGWAEKGSIRPSDDRITGRSDSGVPMGSASYARHQQRRFDAT